MSNIITPSEAINKVKDAYKTYINKNALVASNLVISENITRLEATSA